LVVDRARHHVAWGELGALVVIGHEPVAGFGMLELPALAADRLGDPEILDLEIVETGRVELHHLHVGNAGPGAPGHRAAGSGGGGRSGREELDAARAASGPDRGPRGMRLDPARGGIERVVPPDAARARVTLPVPPSDQVDTAPVGESRYVGIFLGRL